MTKEDIQKKIDGYKKLLHEINSYEYNLIMADTLNLDSGKYYSIPTNIITKEEILYRICKQIDMLEKGLL